jgi:hypothetical protein
LRTSASVIPHRPQSLLALSQVWHPWHFGFLLGRTNNESVVVLPAVKNHPVAFDNFRRSELIGQDKPVFSANPPIGSSRDLEIPALGWFVPNHHPKVLLASSFCVISDHISPL